MWLRRGSWIVSHVRDVPTYKYDPIPDADPITAVVGVFASSEEPAELPLIG